MCDGGAGRVRRVGAATRTRGVVRRDCAQRRPAPPRDRRAHGPRRPATRRTLARARRRDARDAPRRRDRVGWRVRAYSGAPEPPVRSQLASPAILVAIVSLAATYIPARRALGVDATSALRDA